MSRVHKMFGKKFKDLTIEEKRLYMKVCRIRTVGPSETRAIRMFGKRFKDLTKKELRELHKTEPCYLKRLKGFYKTTFSYNHFGKQWRDLTPEEKKEFNRIRKQESRKRLRGEEWIDI